MTVRDDKLVYDLLAALGSAAFDYAQPKIKSNQLRRALTLDIFPALRLARLEIPHYWAVYVHDGRGPFGARRARFLVWFRNPNNDPRLSGGLQPERYSQVRRLTKQQFQFWLNENRRAFDRGTIPPMIVLRDPNFRPLRHPGNPPTHFFENFVGGGMHGFVDVANSIGSVMVKTAINERLADILSISMTAKGVVG